MLSLFLLVFGIGVIYFISLGHTNSKPKKLSFKLSDKIKLEEKQQGILQIEKENMAPKSLNDLPSYYAQEGGIYYNPRKNKLKLAGPRTRLQSMYSLGYTEFVGEI